MTYIEQTLATNEIVRASARFPVFYRWAGWGSVVAGPAIAAILLTKSVPAWIAGLVLLTGLLVGISVLLWMRTTEITVTNQRLIVKRGVVTRHTDEIELWAIEEVNLDQGLLGRALGIGRISVHGTGDDMLPIPIIAEPLQFQKAIQSAIGQAIRPAQMQPNSKS